MDKSTFEALVFKGLFEVNNIARERDKLPPITLDKSDRMNGWFTYKRLGNSMKMHIDRLYADLKPYLD